MDRRAYSQENRNQRADSAAKTVVISPKAEAETPNPTGIKGLFEGLSVSQVTAGALAAVTSMLLSAQIGIAGSVIGVAVGSDLPQATSIVTSRKVMTVFMTRFPPMDQALCVQQIFSRWVARRHRPVR